MRTDAEIRAINTGFWFQVPMIILYIGMVQLYKPFIDQHSPWIFLSRVGLVLFIFCLIQLYVLKGKDTGLITTGVFRYTRHPMYTGILLMDSQFWLPRPASVEPLFFILQSAFVLCLVIAAYFQEKETLARFGEVARAYYAKTPRLFFLYPLRAWW